MPDNPAPRSGQPCIGIYEKALPPGPWPDMLATARRAGFDFVEMSVDESDARLHRLTWDAPTRQEMRTAIRASGVRVPSMCLSGHRRYGLGSADASVGAHAATMLRQAVLLAQDLGIRIVQIAGYHAYYEKADDGMRDRYVEALVKGAEFAARFGVMLAVENIDTVDLPDISTALDLVREVGSPWFQLYPDVGNLAVNKRPVVDEIRRAPGHAVAMHLKDARPGEPRRVPFGAGTVPFGEVFRALDEENFQGPFMIEMWNDAPATAERDARAALTWIRAAMSQAADRPTQEA